MKILTAFLICLSTCVFAADAPPSVYSLRAQWAVCLENRVLTQVTKGGHSGFAFKGYAAGFENCPDIESQLDALESASAAALKQAK